MHFIEKLTFWGKQKTLFRISDPYNCTKFGLLCLNYMKHPLLIKNIKCIQSSCTYFNMEFVLQI